MKRFILIMVDEDMTNTQVRTDDVRASVVSLLNEGYDILVETNPEAEEFEPTEAGIDAIVTALQNDQAWPGEDGSRGLILVDTQADEA